MTSPEIAALHRALEAQGCKVEPNGPDDVVVHGDDGESVVIALASLVDAVLAAQRPKPVTADDPPAGACVFIWHGGWLPMTRGDDGRIWPDSTDVDAYPEAGTVKWYFPMLPEPPEGTAT